MLLQIMAAGAGALIVALLLLEIFNNESITKP